MDAVSVAPYPREKTLFLIHSLISGFVWLVLLISTFGILLIYGLIGYLFHVFGFSYFISYVRGTAAKITPEQFPDIHARIARGCTRLGIKNIPEAYLMQSDGMLNALAAKFLGKHFVILFSPIVEALEERPDALDFYIGHELGHIHRGHTSWIKGLLTLPSSILPLIGAAYRRAQEYTCDRYGLALCNNADDAEFALAVISAGTKRWAQLNRDAFIAQSQASSGFWMSYHELMSDYPWLSKRMLAVRAHSGDNSLKAPSRHLLAKILAFFSLRIPGLGGAAGPLMLIVIVGILAAIALPAYQDYKNYKTRTELAPFDTAAASVASYLRAAKDVDAANIALDNLENSPQGLALKKFGSIQIANGTVILTPRSELGSAAEILLKGAMDPNQVTNANTLTFSAEVGDDNSVTWNCETARKKNIPPFCK